MTAFSNEQLNAWKDMSEHLRARHGDLMTLWEYFTEHEPEVVVGMIATPDPIRDLMSANRRARAVGDAMGVPVVRVGTIGTPNGPEALWAMPVEVVNRLVPV